MGRLVYMTFFGAYRGPAWDVAARPAVAVAARHGVPHPADAHAHGHAHEDDHEVTHGPADSHADPGAGHGHGPWHGPHESPTPMTFPLMALAVGACVAGFVGVPAAIGGGNVIEHFLAPSFTPQVTAGAQEAGAASGVRFESEQGGEGETSEVSRGTEIGLMTLSVLIAVVGIGLAYRFYVTNPSIADDLAERWAGAHRTLSNKYYVDELYNATVISGTFASGRAFWTFDRRVVDGAVNGTGWVTIVSSWLSGLTDRTVVDGLVNLVGRICEEGSFWFRRFQTGLVQNYALLMLFGVFAFVSIYLFVR